MSNSSVAQTPIDFTRDDLAAAIKIAKSKVEQGSAWYRSIERAERNLAAGRFLFDGKIVKLQSATSSTVYTLDTAEPITCSCKDTTGRCWHRAASRLIVRAAEHHAARSAIAATTVVVQNTRRAYTQADFDACYA